MNPDTLMEVEDRLYAIGELKRKYGDNIKEILQYQAWLKRKLKNSKKVLQAVWNWWKAGKDQNRIGRICPDPIKGKT